MRCLFSAALTRNPRSTHSVCRGDRVFLVPPVVLLSVLGSSFVGEKGWRPKRKNLHSFGGLLYPFHGGKVQFVGGQVPAGGEEEGVSFEFPGNPVQEGQAGLPEVSAAAVKGDGLPVIVFQVPPAAVDFHIAFHQVPVLRDHPIDKGPGERGFRVRYQYELGMGHVPFSLWTRS